MCTWYVRATMLVCRGERTVMWNWCSSIFLNGIHVNSGLTHLTILWNQKMDVMENWNSAELPGASGAWVTSTWVLHWPWVPSSGSKSELAHTYTGFSSPQREAVAQSTEHFLGSAPKRHLLRGSLYRVRYSAGHCEPHFFCVFLRVTGAVHTDGFCTSSLSNRLGHSTHNHMNESIFIF